MIGSLLIQPQMLARMQGRSNAAELGDEVMALLHRIVLDPRRAGSRRDRRAA